MMDALDVLRALKAGEISVDDAKKQLAQQRELDLVPSAPSPVVGPVPGDHYGLVLSTVHHLDELSLQEWPVPEPCADEVTIQVHASAVNFPDTMCVRGLYPTMPDYPFVPGFEVSGVIARIGRRDAGFREGDEVIALTGPRMGGHAAQVNVPLANVVHKPANISFEDACSLPVVFGTVYYAFDKGGLAPGEHVLIQTATGGCGLLALQLAHLKGCVCYGTSSRDEKLDILRRLGVEHAINYKTTEFDQEIKRLTHGRGVDVVLNMLSGDGIQKGLNCLAPSGRYLEIAVHALKTSQKLDLSHLVRNQTIHSIDLRQPGVQQGFSARDMLNTMVALLQEERIVPIVSRIYPVHRIREALDYVGEGRHIGKVVISHTRDDVVDDTERCIERLIQQKRRAEAEQAHVPALSALASRDAIQGGAPRLEDIAIIGISGQFPMAPTVDAFWENIARGLDCISEIPASRWPLDVFYDPDPKASGKTYSKWMGVLEDIDRFDPLFFNISPAEAEFMDPQQRLFLQNCWHCIEDAGLSPASLSGTDCGVFVGCAPSDYGQFTGTGGLSAQGLLGGATSILSARISYLLNLKGPCLSIDTACSASVVAMAEACNSLVLHGCDLALAGGVWVMPGPGTHIMTSKTGMLSPDGRCFTFDQRANGFVPGEGVGVVLLKRLADAVRDRDPIYGVIRGWGVNQDGKTNGITAPSVNSQIRLEKEVYERFGIQPDTISLVEAHGTGTQLGDPIEVEALTESFRAFTQEESFCALGSVKSNIGHLLAAAGVSGVMKVLMALKHKMLPPTVHFETLNEHIKMENSPFYINTSLKPWPSAPGRPRRAAVSTFGFSGTNAHMIIEEFRPEPEPAVRHEPPHVPVLVLLSARTAERLGAYAAQMQNVIETRSDLNLLDVAYTLQVGRDAMDHRLAIFADSRQTLADGLAAFLAQHPVAGLFTGQVRKGKGGTVVLDGAADGQTARQSWLDALASGESHAIRLETEQLAMMWVKGLDVDWRPLYDAGLIGAARAPRRISLPGYPFAQQRCWIPDDENALQAPRVDTTSWLHPLVHRNTSDFFKQRFSSTFSGEEFFLADHVIHGQRFLPGVAYLEMARAALVMAGGEHPAAASQGTVRLMDVVWVRPVIAEAEPAQVHIRLTPDDSGAVAFEVYSGTEDAALIHSQGTAARLTNHDMETASHLDLPALQAQLSQGHLSGEQCYRAFDAMHMTYGPGHRGIDALYLVSAHGPVQVLARLQLPEFLTAGMETFTLHPCLLDSALQASIGLIGLAGDDVAREESAASAVPALPFAVERVDILGPCTPVMWALLRESSLSRGVRKMDIDLSDETGEIRVRIRGYTSRILESSEPGPSSVEPTRLHPLIDADVSDDSGHVFAKRFSNRDFILRDHIFDGVRILPAAAIVEMAREAVARTGTQPKQLTNFLVGYPIVGTEAGIDTRLALHPEGDHVHFTLSSRDPQSGQDLIHSQGTMETGEWEDRGLPSMLDLDAIRARLPHRADLEHDYDAVVPHAVAFGPALRTLREFQHGEREALAKIAVGEESRGDDFGLHPLIIDGVFQAGAVAYYQQRQRFQPSVLFAIERLEILAPTGHTCYAHLNLLDAGDGDTMAFDAAICDNAGHVVARMTRITIKVVAQPEPEPVRVAAPVDEGADLLQKTETYLKASIAKVTKIAADQIDAHEDFGRYGIDSLTIMNLNNLLGEDFQALPRTLFFEYGNVRELSAYFVAHHTERLQTLFGPPAHDAPVAQPADQDTRQPVRFVRPVISDADAQGTERPAGLPRFQDIAIVGMAGRYPGAERLSQFWENLKLGRDCVTEIPAEAWNYQAVYDPERKRENAIYCKWGGFIKDADKFDPLFFQISPLEAEVLDPQARLFLQTAWHCIEDAGYAPQRLAASCTHRNVGVFAGVSTNEYQLLKLPSSDIELNGVAYLFSVANRVSYHLGLHGPSISVDTACSSSLSAIHMACKSILNGECEAAIAGGVNLSLHPHKYQYLSKGNFLASDGRCRSFGASGDGYVPGEGVGAVLLKPLHRAVQDGDHIYGVIKGSAMNHGGKTSGFTVPSPNAQGQLIRDVLDGANIDPRTITYVEAHGTGTELGDPIELAGLVQAFAGATSDRQFCAIGSCKSNIGHLEAAAGIAQLTKVLLQLQHRQLVPSIHTRELNPNLDFEPTPFYIQRELSAWEPETQNGRRRAGISSFGVGGANAHLIVEAYEPDPKPRAAVPREPQLLVLSAWNEERLRVYAGDMAEFLSQSRDRGGARHEDAAWRSLATMMCQLLNVPEDAIDPEAEFSDLGFDAITLGAFAEQLNETYQLQLSTPFFTEYRTLSAVAEYLGQNGVIEVQKSGFNLRDLAYTMQLGREALGERLAVVVSDLAEAVESLQRFHAGDQSIAGLYRGNARRDKAGLPQIDDAVVADWLRNRNLTELSQLWVSGLEVDWALLYGDDQPSRLSLPTYPFARERYWLPQADDTTHPKPAAVLQAIHPLLHRNTSDFSEQRFSSNFSGREFFLAGHRIQGQPILPGVAYLEMARAAVSLAHGGLATGLRLRDVVWARPFVAIEAQDSPETDRAEPNPIHIGLYLDDNGGIGYEVYGEAKHPDDDPPIYSQGRALVAEPAPEAPLLDLAALRRQCDGAMLDSTACYQVFKAAGIDYGPGHQGIETLYVGTDQVLARLQLPEAVADTLDGFVLHPSLVDAALQAAIGLMGAVEQARPALPFALDELDVRAPCTPAMWALVRHSDSSGPGDALQKLDIDVCDDQGRLCVSLRGLSCRVLSEPRPAQSRFGTLMMTPAWRESRAGDSPSSPDFSRHLVIFCEPHDVSREQLEFRLSGLPAECLLSSPGEADIAARYQAHLLRVFEDVRAILQSRPEGPVLVQVVVPGEDREQRLLAAISSLLKTAHLENPNLVGQVIEVWDHFAAWCDGLAEKLRENRERCGDSRVRYHGGARLVASWDQLAVLPEGGAQESLPLPWKDDGVYLITGGAGGLGLLFAEEIARRTERVTVVLVGRSSLGEEPSQRLAGLRDRFPHAAIDYRRVDVTDEAAVVELVQSIRQEHGNLHGIIHSAGVLRDNFILKKNADEVRAVLAPKVTGLVHLDRASRDCDLDWFVLFSSGSGAEGNAGQADYAAANAFMDAYAAYRNALADMGRCHGRTLAMNWPLWRAGGMRVDAHTEELLASRMGMIAMTAESGFRALYRGLASNRDQVWVLEGDLERLTALFEGSTSVDDAEEPAVPVSEATEITAERASERMRDKAVIFFRELLASAIKLPVDRIEADVPLEQYGFDSILVVELTNQLEKVFGPLSKTLFFEYQDIAQLTGYFLDAHTDKLQALLGLQESTPAPRIEAPAPPANLATVGRELGARRRRFATTSAAPQGQESVGWRPDERQNIAIIGLAGRYPMADNLDAFWANLKDGRDCITEIPKARWDHDLYFDADRNTPGKTYSKWGGFINDVDCFDPLLFNISPREAEMMEPQERLFLECVYELIEDAGYTRASLAAGASPPPGAGAPVGVYVGVMYEEYQLFGAQEQARGRFFGLPGSPSSIANRVSYVFNFHGPSMAVDTMCSSSLTTIHLACESLKRGECKLAVAGGVNVSIHPNKYLLLGQGRFVSSKGRCESFGEGGDGYVPGEGVGAVLLKPLAEAVADGDRIYGVIKGTAINHGGKTNGYSVPNPRAQANVIGEAFKRSGIDPRTVSYLEAHGTGTSLGDPIEIAGLVATFRESTDENQFCYIGSVKSNIGHCESAAGIAGVTKVLLQLKHGYVAPSLHSETLNPNIDFVSTPFTVPQTLREWQRPVVAAQADGGQPRTYARIAGVSSFGAGGSNAHVVIEEYVPELPAAGNRSGAPALIPLSAKNEDRLMRVVENVHHVVTSQPELDLAALAYTLQVGREALEERLALVVTSVEELAAKLAAILSGDNEGRELYRGTVAGRGGQDTVALFAADDDLQTAVDAWIAKGKYEKLLSLWVKGLTLDWRRLYGEGAPHGRPPQRMGLPTYPFDRQRYWVPEFEGADVPAQAEILHPLLHRNTSDLAEQRFSTTLTGREFFLRDHRLGGQAVLPGVAYLEMARAALDRAARALVEDGDSSPMVCLQEVIWTRPVVVENEAVPLHIALFPGAPSQSMSADEIRVAYEIYSDSAADEAHVIHSRGYAALQPELSATALDLAELQAACSLGTLSADDCYAAFAEIGIDYGPAHRTIDVLHLGPDQVLARLCLPPAVADTRDPFVLHPSLMDGALQAAIGLYLDDQAPDVSRPALPFAVEHVAVFAPCAPVMWAHIRHASGAVASGPTSGVRVLDIDMCDEDGRVCARLTGLAARIMDGEASREEEQAVPAPPPETAVTEGESQADTDEGEDLLAVKTGNYFKQLFASVLKLPAHQIRGDAPLEQYGIDSVMVMELTGVLEQTFGPLSKTLFFEYQDIESLSRYFVTAHQARLQSLFPVVATADHGSAVAETQVPAISAQDVSSKRGRWPRFALVGPPMAAQQNGVLDIAIIGLAGRYPGARNVREFWENLRAGKDCITEIPRDRWNHDLYFDEDRYKPGKTYSKWGGFIDGVREFDPLFFNISPREAEMMDPQERLFLQCVFEVLEDAGYTRESLARYQNLGLQGNVGVYVGVMYEEYQLYGVEETMKGRPLALSGTPSSIANRVSYLCNFHGPSMAVDTMCSSSLTTIHLACESLVRGHCELAVAGGVNVSIHPNKYIGLGQGQFVSSKGRCESFGAGGDGYVPGEGVGAVLLKPLANAVADGDHIYGVIKGTALNHGGKTNGYSVPNPNAQANVIGRVFQQTGIDPRAISYLEAHGTGTSLGDPIEITGLTKAFRDYTQDNQFCAIGSAKSNIGHCESAAGIAGITKVLLQLQHRQLAPSLHAETLNPHIDFANSPFVVQQSLEAWSRPQLATHPERDERRELPRMAGISSFGAGGSNAHVIIEEYVAADVEPPHALGRDSYVIVLSARAAERLQEAASNLHQALTEARYTDADLPSMAYTLQVGREAMIERLAFTAISINELTAKLEVFLADENGSGNATLDEANELFRGRAGSGSREALTLFSADHELQEAIDKWLQRKKYDKLLSLWVQGLTFDWQKLYGENALYGPPPRRISLPTYPFARESYWVPEVEGAVANVASGAGALHPLLHRNTSVLAEQRFSTTLNGQESFLADHRVQGHRVLPGAAYLEMARVAVEHAGGLPGSEPDHEGGLGLRHVVWMQPVAVAERPVLLHIALGLEGEPGGEAERVTFEVYSKPDAEAVTHAQGQVVQLVTPPPTPLDLEALQAACGEHRFSDAECYAAFSAMGLDYGPTHRGIETLYASTDHALARLSLTDVEPGMPFVLHPGLMDAAIQASVGLYLASAGTSGFGGAPEQIGPSLPFALEVLDIYGPCTRSMWAHLRRVDPAPDRHGKPSGLQKLDIDLCDEQGKICVRMQGLSFKTQAVKGGESEPGTLMLRPAWPARLAVGGDAGVPLAARRLVIVCDPDDMSSESLQRQLGEADCLVLPSQGQDIAARFSRYMARVVAVIQELIGSRPEGEVLLQVVVPANDEGQLCAGIAGVLKTARLEFPNLLGQVIEVEGHAQQWREQDLLAILEENRLSSADLQVRYQDGQRYVASWYEVEAKSTVDNGANDIPWKDHGVYLITGGAGGLGLIFAREIVQRVKDAVLILTGRSALDEARQSQLRDIAASRPDDGSIQIDYQQIDVTNREAVTGLIQRIRETYGQLNGVIHSAGLTRDRFLLQKTESELQAVLAPKVTGLVNLDQASRDEALDFFILFSSVAGALGNLGQADYAGANAFMDRYAAYRNTLVAAGQRHGRTLSINWPLWREGGMQVDEQTEQMMRSTGVIPMPTASGIRALYRSFASGYDQVMVIEGDRPGLRAALAEPLESAPPVTEEPARQVDEPALVVEPSAQRPAGATPEQLREHMTMYFREILAPVLKLPVDVIEADVPLEEFGIDSVIVMQVTNYLEQTFGTLPKTLFFEYSDIEALSDYFVRNHGDTLANIFDEAEPAPASSEPVSEWQPSVPAAPLGNGRRHVRRRPVTAAPRSEGVDPSPVPDRAEDRADGGLDIAIIGLAGRYPGANTMSEFWQNLSHGKNCITEIPQDRWDHARYFDDEKGKPGKTYGKWGGFIDGVDQFDPLFFNISPLEAEYMDPLERLFLQCVIETLDDAGYTRESLAPSRGPNGSERPPSAPVGVFVGVMNEEYMFYGIESQVLGQPFSLPGMSASIANRASYFCNFHGPSLSVNTMCSSSLTAIHLACQSLKLGECELAIAGGVSVSIHPNKYLGLAQGRFLSTTGRCQAFGQGGDGYVPGEGVGAVLLKPLSTAIASGDHIYGIIKASAVNHGAKSNGFTVPNPDAQANVIGRAFEQAAIDPRAVSYLEAHGTGTALGDPIEMMGLTRSFNVSTADQHFCAIGSVKSNVGHCEGAAGIAGVTKVLLQLKHRQLAPSLHAETLNPNIDFEHSPFVVQRELAEWKRPVIEFNGQAREYPRIAGVSSFGAGGSNAHVIIEEYTAGAHESRPHSNGGVAGASPALIVLSAKNEERLDEQARQLLAFITEAATGEHHLADVAYTLQVGREAMPQRLALMVTSLDDLCEKLSAYLRGDRPDGLFLGRAADRHLSETRHRDKETEEALAAVDEATITTWLAQGAFADLLAWWVKGLVFDWRELYGKGTAQPRRISLPSYPFAQERYWVPVPRREATQSGVPLAALNGHSLVGHASNNDFHNEPMFPGLHPMLHQNTSTLAEQRFSTTFTGGEFFLADHVVQGQPVLPGVAYLEMARAAAVFAMAPEQGHDSSGLCLKYVVWSQPIVPGEANMGGVQVHLRLVPDADGRLDYEIYTESETGAAVVHSRGRVESGGLVPTPHLALTDLQAQCSTGEWHAEQCYEAFRAMGLAYGPAHQAITTLYLGAGQVLAKLTLPANVEDSRLVLHPSMLDAAFQATIGLVDSSNEPASPGLSLPFALDELEVYGACTASMWAFIRHAADGQTSARVRKLDLDLCDETGALCVRMKGLSFRVLTHMPGLEAARDTAAAKQGGEAPPDDGFYQWLSEQILNGNLSEEQVEKLIMASE